MKKRMPLVITLAFAMGILPISKASAPNLLEKTVAETASHFNQEHLQEGFTYSVLPQDSLVQAYVKYKKFMAESEIAKKISKEDSLYGKIFSQWNSDVPPYLSIHDARAMIFIESSDKPREESPAGARGYMQMTRGTWNMVVEHFHLNPKEWNFNKKAFEPSSNIHMGILYLVMLDGELRENFPLWDYLPDSGKKKLFLASYNGGIGNLKFRDWDINNMNEETRDYVPKVQSKSREFEERYKPLYKDLFD